MTQVPLLKTGAGISRPCFFAQLLVEPVEKSGGCRPACWLLPVKTPRSREGNGAFVDKNGEMGGHSALTAASSWAMACSRVARGQAALSRMKPLS